MTWRCADPFEGVLVDVLHFLLTSMVNSDYFMIFIRVVAIVALSCSNTVVVISFWVVIPFCVHVYFHC